MKKLIAVILAVMSFTVIQTSAVVERVYYDFTFADGYYYDLKTGVGKSDARFAVSSRKPVKSDSITIVGSNWHHILWWGENNQYIGYHNSTKSSYKTNLFNAYETSYPDIDVIDYDSFVSTTTKYTYLIFGNDWVLDNIIPGATYMIAYDVTLLYKPDSPPTYFNFARFRLTDGVSTILFASIPHSQYLDWEVGETVHVENTVEIPSVYDGEPFDLSGYSFYFNSAQHGEERSIMRVDNVRLTVGDTIPTGRYFGTAGPVVTPPEGAKYFHLQVCKERDNLIDFIEYPPQGALDVIDKNSFAAVDIGAANHEVIYEDLDDDFVPRMVLDYGRTYYIRYSIVKLAEDGGNDKEVGILFWKPYAASWESVGLGGSIGVGPPRPPFRLSPGISDDWFQMLPIGESALVEGTFIADDYTWPGSPYHGHEPYPKLWVYTSLYGADMIFDNIYILPADSYDAQIENIREDPVEVFERFRATQVYYEREAITPPEETNLAERVEAWLDNNNLNNNLFKTLVSIVVIVAVVIGLALLKAPGVAIIFSVVLIFALGVMFGWIAMWLVIPIALLCLGLILLKLKRGGGGIDESD